ncbi:glycosyltransferase [Runella sp. CRIBMP]|uniref:glycosyltransferase family 2 protein n=1 Tax=Runella sp. CRIBMP TaxID=2683261 RepID=UPI00141287BF|nr:glycosyltransferase family 2 protein [Runella sp. CRIBMP]NBB22841.1 glycosyltransferase [Runella sp. CRIBMP]
MLITIIIATYNAAEFLQRSLDSIRLQKTDDIELIVMDAVSKDTTLEILKNNSDIIDYFKSEKDKGVYDAWNKGIRKAKGTYIMFLGADDVLLPGAIEAYLRFIKSNSGFDIISSRLDLVDEMGNHRRYVGELFVHERYCKRTLSFAHPGMLHSVNIFNKVGLFSLDYKICSDAEFFIKNGGAFKAGFVDYVTVRMQQGGMSVSYKAIWEAYKIRKNYHVINPFQNSIGMIKMVLLLFLSKTKTKLLGLG